VLFTAEFAEMEVLFGWQMVGDTLKIGSWVLAYLMLGKAMVKMFIASEIAFAAGFYGWSYLFTNMIGLEGVTLAHALNYAMYWIVMAYFIGKIVLKKG
jgi:PST family polysaccharide transporter